jgi:prophage regulatory protein
MAHSSAMYFPPIHLGSLFVSEGHHMPTVPAEQSPPYVADEATLADTQRKPPPKVQYTPQQPRAPPHLPNRILRWREVRSRVGLSRSTIWRMVRRGEFPKPLMLGRQSIGWLETELNLWIETRAALRDRATDNK